MFPYPWFKDLDVSIALQKKIIKNGGQTRKKQLSISKSIDQWGETLEFMVVFIIFLWESHVENREKVATATMDHRINTYMNWN